MNEGRTLQPCDLLKEEHVVPLHQLKSYQAPNDCAKNPQHPRHESDQAGGRKVRLEELLRTHDAGTHQTNGPRQHLVRVFLRIECEAMTFSKTVHVVLDN